MDLNIKHILKTRKGKRCKVIKHIYNELIIKQNLINLISKTLQVHFFLF